MDCYIVLSIVLSLDIWNQQESKFKRLRFEISHTGFFAPQEISAKTQVLVCIAQAAVEACFETCFLHLSQVILTVFQYSQQTREICIDGRTQPAPSPQIFSSHSSTTFCCSSVILAFLRLKKFRQNFKSLSVLLRLLLKHASRLVFRICRKSSSRFSSIVSKRMKSASMAGHNPAPSPQIFSSYSSTTFCCSYVILVFCVWRNFGKTLSPCLSCSGCC